MLETQRHHSASQPPTRIANYLVAQADSAYGKAVWAGRRRRLWAALTRQRDRVWHLPEVKPLLQVRGQSFLGQRTIPVAAIQGSEGRVEDFDITFAPRRTHTRERWLNIATAFYQGLPLPPIDVIQIGEIFFVRDGHHRVSVAQAFGQAEIDALVTVWQVVGALPWEQPCTALPQVAQPLS